MAGMNGEPDLTTVSNSVPINYGDVPQRRSPSLTPTAIRTSNTDVADFKTSPSIRGENYGIVHPPSPGRRHLKMAASEPQIREEDESADSEMEELSQSLEITEDLPQEDQQTERAIISSNFRQQLSFPESHSQPSFNTRPRIHIKLVRAKSGVFDTSEDKENEPVGNKKCVRIDDDMKIIEPMYSSSPDVSSKAGGNRYWKRVREMFRSFSSKSLASLDSDTDKDLTLHKKKTNREKGRKNPESLDTSLESISGSLPETAIKGELKIVKNEAMDENGKYAESPDMSVNGRKDSDKLGVSARFMLFNDSFEDETFYLNDHQQERSYSLLKANRDTNDSTTVNFTRIPSLRRHEAHCSLLLHFRTVLPPEDDEETIVIKEATHIHLLKNNESVVTDLLSNKMVLFDATGYPKITFAVESGSEPWATCLTSDGVMAVTLKRQGCVSLWSTKGEPITEFGQDVLSSPTGIQCDTRGRFLVADEQANAVYIFNKSGEFLTELTGPEADNISTQKSTPSSLFSQPRYICTTNSGNYVISDSGNHCVKIFDSSLKFLRQFGCYGRLDGHFKFPYGVASDDNGNLYVADHYNNRISLFSPEGEFLEQVLTSQDDIHRPKGLGIKNRRLYVTHGDLRSNKISVFKLSKIPHKSVT